MITFHSSVLRTRSGLLDPSVLSAIAADFTKHQVENITSLQLKYMNEYGSVIEVVEVDGQGQLHFVQGLSEAEDVDSAPWTELALQLFNTDQGNEYEMIEAEFEAMKSCPSVLSVRLPHLHPHLLHPLVLLICSTSGRYS